MHPRGTRARALAAAFPYTIPIFAGFWFLGMAYGIYMNVSGFSFWYPFLMGLTIFGGSLEFVAVSMLLGPFAPLQTFLMTLMIQARHLFYGIAMLDRFKGMGWKKFYLIFGMCDETFSILCTVRAPEGVDEGWFMFFVTLLDQVYWVSGAALGGLLGSVLTFDTQGLDFMMTAMFVVIFLEQWLKEKKHITALVGLGASALCLWCFGPDSFLVPAMVCILGLLTVFRRPIEGTWPAPAPDRAQLADQRAGQAPAPDETRLTDQRAGQTLSLNETQLTDERAGQVPALNETKLTDEKREEGICP